MPAGRDSSGVRALTTFVRLPLAEQRTMLWVLAVSTVVELAIRRMPLPRVSRALGLAWMRDADSAVGRAPSTLSARDRRVVRCTRRVMRWWPFCKGTCLRQSLVIGYALRRHRPRLQIGVALPSTGFGAHAWLEVCGLRIGAAEGFHSFDGPTGSAA